MSENQCCGNYKDIAFDGCPKHTEILFVGTQCPVCRAERIIAVQEQQIAGLDNQIASLQMLQATAAAE